MTKAKTQIFKTYKDFQNREDKSVNGVSPEFAEKHPNWQQMNESNKGCWDCWGCVDCVDCVDCTSCESCEQCHGCDFCDFCESCTDCNRCNRCNRCTDCTDSNDCKDCKYCSDCHECASCIYCDECENCNECDNSKDLGNCNNCDNCYCFSGGKKLSFLIRGEKFTPPKVANIHQKVYEAASQDGALDMRSWHACNTTHCRAGWAVTLAGEDGKGLEAKTSTLFTAMAIYRASSDIGVSPSMFFVSDEEALKDMKRCADLEKAGVICNE